MIRHVGGVLPLRSTGLFAVILAVALSIAPSAALANTASVSVGVSANPTQGVPVSVSVSGSSQLGRSLYIYMTEQSVGCGPTPSAELNDVPTVLATGVAVGPGAFSEQYRLTPADHENYTVCAYVDDTLSHTADVTAGASFDPDPPPASVLIVSPAAPTIGVANPVIVRGQTLIPESLMVTVCDSSGDCSALTPDSGITIGAGAFSQTFSFTPLDFGPTTVQAQINDLDEDADFSGSSTMIITVPNANLRAPVDGARGPQLNPQFSRQGGSNEKFALVLGRVGGKGKVINFLQIQQGGYVELPSSSISASNGLADPRSLLGLGGVATFHINASGAGTAGLDAPLAPGRYVWRVVSSGPANADDDSSIDSPRRKFVVLGPRLTHLNVRSIRQPGATSRYPGDSVLEIGATAYSKVKIRYSHAGRAATVTQYWGDTTQGELRINWSCSSPGGRIGYTVTAYDDEGDSKTVGGSAVPVSRSRCQALRAAELAAQRAKSLARRQAAVLGWRYAFPSGAGFGIVRPRTVYLGGDPTGRVTQLRWSGWGSAETVGYGQGWCPGQSVASGHVCAASLHVYALGSCHGRRAYRIMGVYFKPGPRSNWTGGARLNVCTGQ
jgi:hypothetical protein